MTEEEERTWRIQHAYLLRTVARALYRMERNGLHDDAEQIRAELATMGIELPHESNSNQSRAPLD